MRKEDGQTDYKGSPNGSAGLQDVLKGVFVVADGIDCGGKGTGIETLGEWAQAKGFPTFNLGVYQKEAGLSWPPKSLFSFPQGGCLITAEPPYAGGGWELRNGPLQHLDKYTAMEVAEMFSAYRTPLFGEVIVPWLKRGGFGFQERSVSTSCIYQPIQAQAARDRFGVVSSVVVTPVMARRDQETVTIESILGLYGNKRAMETVPDLLLLMRCDPEEAAARVAKRANKQDNCDFERLEYLRRIDAAYRSGLLDDLFGKRGSKVVRIDTSGLKVEETKAKVLAVWEGFLEERRKSLIGSGDHGR